jgi:uncharacterized membrane protein YgaE (UPF0421/DUF939 family)
MMMFGRNIYTCLEAAIVGLACFIFGNYLSSLVHDGKGYIDGLWCMISSLVVLQSLTSDVINSAKERVLGTITGSVLSGLGCSILGYTYLTIFVSIGTSAGVMSAMNMPNAIRIATSTAAIISGYGFISKSSFVLNAMMRSLDTIVGVGFSVLFVLLSYELNIRNRSTNSKVED